MYTLYLLIDIVYVYHSSHVNKYEANNKSLDLCILFVLSLIGFRGQPILYG